MTESESSLDGTSGVVQRSVERILDASSVRVATNQCKTFLEVTGGEVKPLPSNHEDSHGRMRVVVGDDDVLFLKTLRNSGNHIVVDLFCDLVGYRIADRFNAPVAKVSLMDLDDHEPALALRFVDEDLRDYNGDTADLVNANELPTLFAVEVLMENTDDKDRHFRLAETEAGREIRFIDHGHALIRRFIDNIDEAADVVERSPNTNGNVDADVYCVERVEDAEETLSLIHEMTDQQIVDIVDWALDQLRGVDHPDVEAFLDDTEFYRKVAIRMLQENRDKVYELAEERLT